MNVLCYLGIHKLKPMYKEDDDNSWFPPLVDHYICERCGERVEPTYDEWDGTDGY